MNELKVAWIPVGTPIPYAKDDVVLCEVREGGAIVVYREQMLTKEEARYHGFTEPISVEKLLDGLRPYIKWNREKRVFELHLPGVTPRTGGIKMLQRLLEKYMSLNSICPPNATLEYTPDDYWRVTLENGSRFETFFSDKMEEVLKALAVEKTPGIPTWWEEYSRTPHWLYVTITPKGDLYIGDYFVPAHRAEDYMATRAYSLTRGASK